MFTQKNGILVTEKQVVMATFKICIRKQRRDGLFPVYIRITHNRKTGYIKTEKIVDSSCLKKGELKDPTLLSYFSNLIKLYSEMGSK